MNYPPYTVTSTIRRQVAAICEQLAELAAGRTAGAELFSARQRQQNRLRTIHATLAIEGNRLSLEQVAAIIEGKGVMGPARDVRDVRDIREVREVREVRGAVAACEKLEAWQAHRLKDLLSAHALLMRDLVDHPGHLRTGGVGIYRGSRLVHLAPPAHLVHAHLQRLLGWLAGTDEHPLVAASVFHAEFEFIHPFADGNGRMGRLWQMLILSRWNPLLAHVPVDAVVHSRKADYYDSLAQADAQGEATAFVEFMLVALGEALAGGRTDQAGDQAGDQASDQAGARAGEQASERVRRLLEVLGHGEKSTELMADPGLRHAPAFRTLSCARPESRSCRENRTG